VGCLGFAMPARADEVRATVDLDRDTSRVQLGAAVAVFASYPMSIEDPGGALFATRPLWLGERYRFFQWALDAHALAGFGTYSHHGHVALGARAGFDLFFGSVFGLELRFEGAGLAQLGPHTVGGFGIGGGSAYVFRLWDDDRKRLKLAMSFLVGGYFARDPGNDLGAGAGRFSLGLGYEMPY
ncbi:MAG: hypothetical protein WKG01_42600, partial [Kofleriaceae bacterium]